MVKYNLEYIGISKQGNRKLNQDSLNYFINDHGFLVAIIADGMGGHEGGEVASQIAVDEITSIFKSINFELLKEKKIKETFLMSIKMVLDKMRQVAKKQVDLLEMGTTLNINVFVDNHVYILNVGDSRTSSITSKFVNSITVDQNLATIVQKFDRYNDYKNAQNILVSSLGPKKDLRIDLYKAKLNQNGYILITTDGVHNHISKEELLTELNSNQILETKLDNIIEKAYINGSSDNMSGILIKYYEKK